MHRKAINHLRRADPVLARVIERVGRCTAEPHALGTHFDAVLRSIVYQQLSGAAAATIYGRLEQLFGGRTPLPVELLDASDEQLRAVGLSRQKIGYMRDLAGRVQRLEVPIDRLHDLDDAEIMAALTSVKGIGVWTAQMFLMFRLGRPDVLPDLDLGIRKAIRKEYRLRKMPTSERVQQIGKKWAPYRTVASWYLWRSLDNRPAAAEKNR
ncbi:MAG: DNA-3-methyladenine glycosylase 2 family protein [Gemmatimonadota bacterium]|nr:DNA-3-methyladenine glycosylase 2 family protein [Gemmatimonadota bacterium]